MSISRYILFGLCGIQTGSSTDVPRRTRRANAGWPGIDGAASRYPVVPLVDRYLQFQYKSLAKKLSVARRNKKYECAYKGGGLVITADLATFELFKQAALYFNDNDPSSVVDNSKKNTTHLKEIQTIVASARVNGQQVDLASVNQIMAESIERVLLNGNLTQKRTINKQTEIAMTSNGDCVLISDDEIEATDIQRPSEVVTLLTVQEESLVLPTTSYPEKQDEGDIIITKGFVAVPINQLQAATEGRPIIKTRKNILHRNSNLIQHSQEDMEKLQFSERKT
ncbi:hypothetical protein DPMN_098557 [Dreissena polymorpha]|uniref:Uncharacterized protein n=1 Tax=Dreissena polymorpha TaxID=45954 RepID=A0A9D4LDU3_DREPO|nr:hypothetical protein DPMN_098557 [Dreissena polymorpha]